MQKNENPIPQFTLHQGEIVNDFELKNGFLSIHQSAALYSFLTEIHQKLLAFTGQAIKTLCKNNDILKKIYFKNFYEDNHNLFTFYPLAFTFNERTDFVFKIISESDNNFFEIRGHFVSLHSHSLPEFNIISNDFPEYNFPKFDNTNTQTKIKTLDTLNTYLGTILVETLGENWQSL